MEAGGESAFTQSRAISGREMFLKDSTDAQPFISPTLPNPAVLQHHHRPAGSDRDNSPLLPREDIKMTFPSLVSFLCDHGGLLLLGLHSHTEILR